MNRRYLKCVRYILIIIIALMLISCAGMHSINSKQVYKAPFYNGKVKIDQNRIAYIPLKFDKNENKPWSNMGRNGLLNSISEVMNAYLKELKMSIELLAIELPIEGAPTISVSTVRDRKSGEDRKMYLYESTPIKSWKEELKQKLSEEKTDHVLYIDIAFGDFLVRQNGFINNKILELGTNYSVKVPWTTDTDTPAEVLYISGAILNKEGKILRSGVEGIIFKETGFLTSTINAQNIISDEEVQKLLEERREDLPGQPLKWKVAIKNLIEQLLSQEDLISG